ncbi:hypothetical protein ACN2CC_28115 [Mesorhizobium muleiense]|uniref:hypothetical protein n=1 Tax=Mesorhizobium muleiense TaxID=1004279 RepID=UPI003AFB5321
MIALSPDYAQRILPYIGGSEVNSSPEQTPHRFIIDLQGHSLDEAQERYGGLVELLRTSVKPDREKRPQNEQSRYLAKRWWLWHSDRPRLQQALRRLDRVLVNCQVGPHLAFVMQPTGRQFALTVNVFSFRQYPVFCLLQSRVHEIWARFFASTLEDRLRYTPSDCFETFPGPDDYPSDASLEAIGQTYHDHRAELMVTANEGMTKIYNRFHKDTEAGAAIQRLRELHDEMDRAVLRAYGWDDLASTLRPQFLAEDTEGDHTYQGRYFWPAAERDLVLSRLLALNAERYAEEVRQGLHEKGRKRARDEGDEQELEVDE